MADPHVLTTLRGKRDELESLIVAYEKKIEAAQFDLMHVNATLRLFEMNGEAEPFPVHMVLNRVLKRGEVAKICQAALAEAPDGLDTRELAIAVIRAKGLDERDAVLRKSIALKVVSILAARERRGQVAGAGKRKGVRVWQRAVSKR
jgi:hypothetical protein